MARRPRGRRWREGVAKIDGDEEKKEENEEQIDKAKEQKLEEKKRSRHRNCYLYNCKPPNVTICSLAIVIVVVIFIVLFLVIPMGTRSQEISSIDYYRRPHHTNTQLNNNNDHAKQQRLKRAIGPQRTSTGSNTGSAKMTQQQQQQQQSILMLGKITDADLMAFEEFLVEQPAFSDLMKAAAATTTTSSSTQKRPSTSANPSKDHLHQYKTNSKSYNGQRTPSSSSSTSKSTNQQMNFFDRWMQSTAAHEDADGTIVRNHLNEDFDDTIATADESFEQDQLAEPPTWVNYLGELGDFIYAQLRQFYDSSPKSPFASSSSSSYTNFSTKQILTNTKLEAIEDLLDDYYYDQYENSQVLYYGPQLVRLGDTFEIGCYLPNEQPAEWTKSGKSLTPQTATSTSGSGSGGQVSSGTNSSSADAGGGESNHLIASSVPVAGNPLRVIRRTSFMGAKQNYSLKIYEAQLSDSGNYRCNRLSRKYHKLIVVPTKISSQQLYLIQQKLLSIIRPNEVASHLSLQQIQSATLATTLRQLNSPVPAGGGGGQSQSQSQARRLSIQASGQSVDTSRGRQQPQQQQQQQQILRNNNALSSTSTNSQLLLPGHLIVENRPLIVGCNITDSALLVRLREFPNFQLAWYKNGRLLRNSQLTTAGSQPATTYTTSSLSRGVQSSNRLQQRAGDNQVNSPTTSSNNSQQQKQQQQQRIQFLGLNGRQMFISSANYGDAGDYLCSWSRLPASTGLDDNNSSNAPSSSDSELPSADSDSSYAAHSMAATPPQATPPNSVTNPLAEGNLQQLVAPVKLRPFKSSYDLLEGNQLRLVCQVQRGYPAAHISWYVGNRLVDSDFLREHPNEFQLLQLEARDAQLGSRAQSFKASPSIQSSAGTGNDDSSSSSNAGSGGGGGEQIVEINPIPASRAQMQMTANGRGQWVEYKRADSEKYLIDTHEHQVRYLQMKLAQLTGLSSNVAPTGSEQSTTSSSSMASNLLQQASLSVLVINKLEQERHTSRYACRATSRANTDEVTTVIRVKGMATQVSRPFNGKATLILGQPLHFECWQIGSPDAQFLWFKQAFVPGAATTNSDGEITKPESIMLSPNEDDTIEIHNNRLILLKPNYQSIGDYICRDLKNSSEQATIQLRAQPYIDDFGVETSHTGKSTVVGEGEKLVLNCHVRDDLPVKIQWLRSNSPDDDKHMVEMPEYDLNGNRLTWDGRVKVEEDAYAVSVTDNPLLLIPTHPSISNLRVVSVDQWTKRLVIDSVGQEHRGYYACIVDNKVTDRTRKTIFVRVTDNIVALWPFLGILAELFILFTIIYVWETQRAQKALDAPPNSRSSGGGATPAKLMAASGSGAQPSASSSKRPASGPSNAFESVPLNR